MPLNLKAGQILCPKQIQENGGLRPDKGAGQDFLYYIKKRTDDLLYFDLYLRKNKQDSITEKPGAITEDRFVNEVVPCIFQVIEYVETTKTFVLRPEMFRSYDEAREKIGHSLFQVKDITFIDNDEILALL